MQYPLETDPGGEKPASAPFQAPPVCLNKQFALKNNIGPFLIFPCLYIC